MLLLFTNVLQFFSAQIFPISSNACFASSAQITCAPRFVIFASKLSSILSRFSIAFHFIFFAFSLARFTLLNCSLPFGTTALYLPILKLILRRCSLSAVLSALFAINDCECSDMFTNITLVYRSFYKLSFCRCLIIFFGCFFQSIIKFLTIFSDQRLL